MKHIEEYKRQGEDNDLQVLHKYNCRILRREWSRSNVLRDKGWKLSKKWIKDILEAVGNLSRNKKKSTRNYIMVKLFKAKNKTKHKQRQL